MDSGLSLGHKHQVKHKQICAGFELRLPILFPMTIIVTPTVPPLLLSVANDKKKVVQSFQQMNLTNLNMA